MAIVYFLSHMQEFVEAASHVAGLTGTVDRGAIDVDVPVHHPTRCRLALRFKFLPSITNSVRPNEH